MSGSIRCEHCLHECFTTNPNTRDPKKRPIPLDVFFNNCKLKINYGKGGSHSLSYLVFVEGNTDVRFWNKVGKTDSIKVISNLIPQSENQSVDSKYSPNNAQGKFVKRLNKKAIECLFCKENQNLLDVRIKEEFFMNDHAIGVVDMDFDHSVAITDSDYDPDIDIRYDPNQFFPLFRTETRDLETMLCKLGGLQFFLSNHLELEVNTSSGEIKRKPGDLQQDLLDQATIPGFARALNAKMRFYLKFDRLKKQFNLNPFCSFIHFDKNLTCADVATLLKMNKDNLLARQSLFFALYRAQCSKRMQLTDEEPWSIVQGHDTMLILESMFRCGRFKYKNYLTRSLISDIDLSNKILKEFFDNKCYGQSELIKQMIDWEKQYHPSHFETSSKGWLFIKEVYMEFNQKTEKEHQVLPSLRAEVR